MRYFILDDDIVSRKILNRIISEELLGEIVGDTDDPVVAEVEIISNKPDIVLVDLLMPTQDGIETVNHLKKRNFEGKFIMISQVENKDMVAKAYNEGVDYFIHKPINKVEVSAVIHKVIEQIKMERSLNKIKESLALFQTTEIKSNENTTKKINSILQNILGDLGILGESGSNDLVEIMRYFYDTNNGQAIVSDLVSLKELYYLVLGDKNMTISENDLKAFEQRLRRTVNQAMTNLASLGLTDYTHPKFEHYATKFFEFNEIRLKMRELDREKFNRKAKINLRKFIYALYNELIARLEYNY